MLGAVSFRARLPVGSGPCVSGECPGSSKGQSAVQVQLPGTGRRAGAVTSAEPLGPGHESPLWTPPGLRAPPSLARPVRPPGSALPVAPQGLLPPVSGPRAPFGARLLPLRPRPSSPLSTPAPAEAPPLPAGAARPGPEAEAGRRCGLAPASASAPLVCPRHGLLTGALTSAGGRLAPAVQRYLGLIYEDPPSEGCILRLRVDVVLGSDAPHPRTRDKHPLLRGGAPPDSTQWGAVGAAGGHRPGRPVWASGNVAPVVRGDRSQGWQPAVRPGPSGRLWAGACSQGHPCSLSTQRSLCAR